MVDGRELQDSELNEGNQYALWGLERQFSRKVSNSHNLRDLAAVFRRLGELADFTVKAKFGSIRERHEHEVVKVYPMLHRSMEKVQRGIDRRLVPRMSKLCPWVVYLEIPMAKEVFVVLQQIRGRTSYGMEIQEDSKSATVTFSKLRRLITLFKEFSNPNWEEFTKHLKHGGEVKLINNEKKGSFIYKKSDESLQVQFYYGYWNEFGVRQH